MVLVSSRDILTDFLESGKDVGYIDVTNMDRTVINIYQALHGYIKRHPEFNNIIVRLHNGDVVLVKSDATIARIY